MRRDFSFPVLALCFLLSGFAALVYQTAWTREFAFVFGTSELAIATVLAAYMAGLAVGAALAGRLAPRVRRPVLAYGLLELGIALAALAVPLLVQGATALLLAWFGEQPGLPDARGGAISLFYLATSFAILMVPTLFMGATLPLLARHAVRSDAELGPRIAWLYAINTAGAVLGTLTTAFVLLDALGLRGTVWVAVALNAGVFVIAALLARIAPLPESSAPGTAAAAQGARWILPLILLSGAVSFSYEVLWTRLLSHRLGASVYAFATMLGSFLLGIALGSALAARFARTPAQARAGFAFAQLGIAALSLAAFTLVDSLPAWLGTNVALLPNAAAGFALLLPAALCIGATYPLAVRVHAGGAADASAASARVYAWNTAGSIAGALGAAYFALPALGFTGVVTACVATSLLLALAASLLGDSRLRLAGALASLGFVALALLPPREPVHLLHATPLEAHGEIFPVVFSAVGESSSVLVTRDEIGRYRVRTNGLPESLVVSSEADFDMGASARWIGGLASLVRPEAESIAVVGLGGGLSVEGIPRTVRDVHVIELEPEVVAANRALSPHRAVDPLADPRVRLYENDARSALLLSGLRFDAIVAQASHPWTAGASHLYTREFFELVRSRLTSRGVFVQWMGPGFVDETLLRSIVATVRAVWPNVRVYDPYGALLFVASNEPLASAEQSVPALLARDAEVMARLGVMSAAHAELWLRLDEAGAEEFSRGAAVITDDRNLLQMRSPAVVAGGTSLQQQPSEALARLAPLRQVRGAAATALVARAAEQGALARIGALLPHGGDAAAEQGIAARIALMRGRQHVAENRLAQALATNAGEPLARSLALRMQRRFGDSAKLAPLLAGADPSDGERVVTEALAASDRGDLAALRALDAALAALTGGDPFTPDATLLRATWRVNAGGDAERAEARALLAGLFVTTTGNTPARLLLAELEDRDPVRRAAPLLRIASDKASPPLTAHEAARIEALARTLPSGAPELMGARERVMAYLDRAARVPWR
ncbi:MAG: fused MFS/spermidine synthase [Deltaproteobacteria bacterium]|nr:fused MFS/spermidine synthase [Deltaproteobacteria bacterium]